MAALVAVYRDRETADAVAEELHERRGVPDAALRVAAPADVRTAIEAEMEQEAAESWNSGVWGLMTSEMARGALLFGFVGAVIGLVLGLPIGYFLYDDSVSTLTRLAIGALVGVLFGATVGALLGGGMAVHSPAEGLAGERGVPVRVDDAAAGIEDVLAAYDPIRIDRFEDGQRVATPVAEGPHGVRESVSHLVENARDPARR